MPSGRASILELPADVLLATHPACSEKRHYQPCRIHRCIDHQPRNHQRPKRCIWIGTSQRNQFSFFLAVENPRNRRCRPLLAVQHRPKVRQPRVRDREADADDPARIRFTPAILPPYVRRSMSIETLLPIFYLKGISTGDFSDALAALLSKDAPGLSATAIGRLKDGWLDEHAAWQNRDLSTRRYVYVWANGIHLEARLEDER
jgi:hypothetical protein